METVVATARTPVEMLREVFADQLNRRDADALMQGIGGPAHRPVEVKA